ncbi:MAG: hypothetical protein ACSLE6_20545 [Mycobacterium sp.]
MRKESVLLIAALVHFGVAGHTGVASAQPAPAPEPTPAAEPAPGSEPAPASVPVAAMDVDGTYSVGVDIVPGTYSTPGPVEGDACYWKRISATGGAIIDNAMSVKPQIVNIEATDLAFKTNGCQPWQLTDAVAPPTPGSATIPALISLAQLRAQLGALNAGAGGFGLPPVPTP